MSKDYDEACKAAATAQGLDPVLEILAERGIEHALEQTGGMCMVVTVRREDTTVAITAEGETYFLGFYPGDDWENLEEHTHEAEVREAKDIPNLLEA